jgi:hypothetical protein
MQNVIVMQTDFFALPIVHEFTAGGTAVEVFFPGGVECHAGHGCAIGFGQGARGSAGGGMTFCRASVICFKFCMSTRWFRRARVKRVLFASGPDCGDWKKTGVWEWLGLFIGVCGNWRCWMMVESIFPAIGGAPL